MQIRDFSLCCHCDTIKTATVHEVRCNNDCNETLARHHNSSYQYCNTLSRGSGSVWCNTQPFVSVLMRLPSLPPPRHLPTANRRSAYPNHPNFLGSLARLFYVDKASSSIHGLSNCLPIRGKHCIQISWAGYFRVIEHSLARHRIITSTRGL